MKIIPPPLLTYSSARLQTLQMQSLENVPPLSSPGTMCLYHVDIPPQNLTVTDIAIQNPGDSDEVLPASSTVVIGVNEISPGAGHHE